jgi:drug/metabolite transporter (DMT)-like permease
VTALLALASAVLVGGSDFLGGVASRRASAIQVAALGQLVSFCIAVPVAAALGADRITSRDAVWSVGSGLAVGAGLALFYSAMRRGQISIVAPVAAVTGVTVPLSYALVRGERPGVAALVGMALAFPAIAIVSIAPDASGAFVRRGFAAVVVLSIAAGVLFGLFFLSFSKTSKDAGLWPVVFSRAASAGLLLLLVSASVGTLALPSLARVGAVIGGLETGAAIMLLLALQRGPLAVAAVLASLYPVTTVLLAAGLLRERLTRLQLGGVALALVAVALVSSA